MADQRKKVAINNTGKETMIRITTSRDTFARDRDCKISSFYLALAQSGR